MPIPSLHDGPARFAGGRHDLGDGVHAWLQPNGGLGESNAGLIVGDGESLLVDTLWDLRLTRRMLDATAQVTRGAPIRTVVNTHGDGDHCWGNQLLAGAEIVATAATARDMLGEDPRTLRLLQRAGPRLGPLANRLPALGAVRDFAAQLQPFDFAGVTLTPPSRTFDGALELQVGGRSVQLTEVGPAHTPGDLIVHVQDAGTVFAADLLFVGVSPIMWVGPVEHWIAGLDRIIELEPRTVVPGHGPVGDLSSVGEMRAYWEFVAPQVRERMRAGMAPEAAATEIVGSADFAAQPFSQWDTPERLVVSAGAIARSDRGETGRMSSRERMQLLVGMGKLARVLRG